MQQIIEAVAKVFGVSVEDLKSRKRDKDTALARQVVMYLISQRNNCTFTDVGRELNRAPATITHGYQKIALNIMTDVWLRNRIADVELILDGEGTEEAIAEAIASQELADEHWSWLGSLLEKVYIDAFTHGYKHGKEPK